MATEASPYVEDAIDMINDLTSSWDTGLDDGVQADTHLVADLGFESLDVVYLVTAIEQRYGRRDLPFEDLLMTEGRYVDDLTVSQVAAFLNQHLSA